MTTKEPSVQNESDQLKEKIIELEAGWKRTAADFDNYRKRIESERSAFLKFAASDAILSLLPVLDNFRRATSFANDVAGKPTTDWISGIIAIEKQFEDVLKQHGVERIAVKVGDSFKPDLHEAIGTESSDQPADQISSIVEDGYTLHGRVLRPTKVKISTGRS